MIHHTVHHHVTAATSYCLKGKTASGRWVNKRTAAHDFLFPGSKIRIIGRQPGPGGIRRYRIEDTGPALSDGHFDLWSSSCHTSMLFGRRPIKWKLGWAPA